MLKSKLTDPKTKAVIVEDKPDSIWHKWAGRVALVMMPLTRLSPTRAAEVAAFEAKLPETSPALTRRDVRYGHAIALGRLVRIRYDGHVHAFDRNTGLCVESPWGLMGDWMIAPEELPRYRGMKPAEAAYAIERAKKAGLFATAEAFRAAEVLAEEGEYEELHALLDGYRATPEPGSAGVAGMAPTKPGVAKAPRAKPVAAPAKKRAHRAA